MPHIVVLGTGGTIASSRGDDGAAVAELGAGELGVDLQNTDISIEYKDLFRLGSYLLKQRHLREIAEAVVQEMHRSDVDGVVITHGTDTMEETAYLLDLVHSDNKPVVLTGAQRPSDDLDSDGPRNLKDAILVAANDAARSKGVLISFADHIYAARATRKTNTTAPSPFQTLGGGPIGQIINGSVQFTSCPIRPLPMALPTVEFDNTRVDVICLYPGADDSLATAAVESGAKAVIIAGSGVGNGNPTIVSWARAAIKDGLIVALGSRVAAGPVVPMYGNGGGADLVSAGAVPLGTLPVFQARILIALLLSTGAKLDRWAIAPYIS
ncbi:asparaginase [Paeniglutamicibacter gangotriensis]|uniref:asparaginase n=2 Tax=Paeniglutamicibacter gangotriensis TaxID=254787 RepID=A0A5B0E3E4_9MICC|nr:asparaginase [Paeniglutamicibacter gangotriensis]